MLISYQIINLQYIPIKMSIYKQTLPNLANPKIKNLFTKHRFIKLKNKEITSENNSLFTELQTLVNEDQSQNDLIIGKGCSCKVCRKNSQVLPSHHDYYLSTTPDSYLNLFSLLQHLTMIEAEQAPRLLGAFTIPLFFFKRRADNQKQETTSWNRKKTSHTEPSFIVFKNNLITNSLQHPFIVKSFYKLSRLIQMNQESSRKLKIKQEMTEKHLINIHQNYESLDLSDSNNFVHTKHFHESIPSYAFPSTKLKSMQSVHQYIIHQEDGYLRQQAQNHKLKKSQPFCIFRYHAIEDGQKVSKCEIFTLQTLGIYDRKRQAGSNSVKAQEKKLNLMYVESYTKIKTQKLSREKKEDGKRTLKKQIQTIYFTQYEQKQLGWLKECPIYQTAELEIKLKLSRLSQIDSSYLNRYQLQERIEDALSWKQPLSTQKTQKLSKYKTYKIVIILEQVCMLKVKRIKLKWMLNDYDELVLLECLQYDIDYEKSISWKKNNHTQHILANGKDYLKEHYNFENLSAENNRPEDILELIRIRQQSKPSLESSLANKKNISSNFRYYSKSLHQISKSTPLYSNIKSKKIDTKQFYDKSIRHSGINLHQNHLLEILHESKGSLSEQKKIGPNQRIDSSTQKMNSVEKKLKALKLVKDRYSYNKKTYKLRPLKTELNEHMI